MQQTIDHGTASGILARTATAILPDRRASSEFGAIHVDHFGGTLEGMGIAEEELGHALRGEAKRRANDYPDILWFAGITMLVLVLIGFASVATM